MTEMNEKNALDMPENEGVLNKEETEERMFTQSQVEEIISERLGRERKVNESLAAVKQLLRNVSQKGLIKGSSYAEMARELAERLKVNSEDETVSNESQPERVGVENEPNAVADANGKENAVETSGGNECEEKRESDNSFVGVLSEIKAKYPKEAVEKLLCGNLFESFAKGRHGSVSEIFGDFCSFMSRLEGEETESLNATNSDYASTAFSSQSGTVSSGAGLTKQQMDIAKSAGMSYREYAQLLESIPKRTGRTV